MNTSAVANPDLINEASVALGSGSGALNGCIGSTCYCADPSGYEIVTHGGRYRTGLDAVKWQWRPEAGAGELVVNSIDADGTKQGYEIKLTRMIADAVSIPS